jgi:hypothetical protein
MNKLINNKKSKAFGNMKKLKLVKFKFQFYLFTHILRITCKYNNF